MNYLIEFSVYLNYLTEFSLYLNYLTEFSVISLNYLIEFSVYLNYLTELFDWIFSLFELINWIFCLFELFNWIFCYFIELSILIRLCLNLNNETKPSVIWLRFCRRHQREQPARHRWRTRAQVGRRSPPLRLLRNVRHLRTQHRTRLPRRSVLTFSSISSAFPIDRLLSLSLSFSHKEQQLKKKKTQKKKFDCLWRQRLLRPSAENFFFSLKSVTVLCSIDLFGVDLTIFCVSVAIVVVSDVILLTGHYRIEFISMLHCYWIKLIWLNWGCWSRSTWNAVGCWTWNRNPADSTDRNGQNQILPTLKQIQQKFFINFLNF